MSFISRSAESSLTFINKKLSAFIVCLIISTLFWFLIVLSKDYTSVVSFPVIYKNLPKDKVVINRLPKSISLEVTSFGFNLLRYKYKNDLEPIVIEVDQLRKTTNENEYFHVTHSRMDYMEKQLGVNTQVKKVMPDTVFFMFDKRATRRVPVKLDASVSLQKQYHIVNGIELKPKEIVVSGPKSVVDSLKYVSTHHIDLKDIERTTDRKVGLLLRDTVLGLKFSSNVVVMHVPVEKYTEGSIDLPIEILNLPANLHIKTYPERVSLTFLASLTNYEKVKNSSFRVTADYNDIVNKRSPRLKLTLSEMPEFIKNVRMEPEKVEYIVIKK